MLSTRQPWMGGPEAGGSPPAAGFYLFTDNRRKMHSAVPAGGKS